MPVTADMVIRNFGITLFLASVGLASVGLGAGAPFVTTVAQSGSLLVGVASLLACMLTVLLVGYFVLKIPFDDLLGVVAGAIGNPAIPASCRLGRFRSVTP